MPDGPSAPVMAAAERIRNLVFECNGSCQECSKDVDCEGAEMAYAAIINRHLGDSEKVLRTAVKWAVRNAREGDGDFCPLDAGGDCIQDEGVKWSLLEGCSVNTVSGIENCWLEFWRKEAEG